jgi:hypothetical protein
MRGILPLNRPIRQRKKEGEAAAHNLGHLSLLDSGFGILRFAYIALNLNRL